MIRYDNIWRLPYKKKQFHIQPFKPFNKASQANRASIKCEIKINIFYVQEKRSSLKFRVSVQVFHTPIVRQIKSIWKR